MTKKKKPKGQEAWDRLDYEKKKRSSFKGLVSAAFSGDAESALKVVSICKAHIDKAECMPDDVREYISHCFTRIRQGEDPNHAFNFTKAKSGRGYEFWKEIRNADVATYVNWLIESGQAKSPDDAAQQVADNYTAFKDKAGIIGEDAIKKAYHQYFPKKWKQ